MIELDGNCLYEATSVDSEYFLNLHEFRVSKPSHIGNQYQI